MSEFILGLDEVDSSAPSRVKASESISLDCSLPEAECQICVCSMSEGKLVALACCPFKVCPDCYEQWSSFSVLGDLLLENHFKYSRFQVYSTEGHSMCTLQKDI